MLAYGIQFMSGVSRAVIVYSFAYAHEWSLFSRPQATTDGIGFVSVLLHLIIPTLADLANCGSHFGRNLHYALRDWYDMLSVWSFSTLTASAVSYWFLQDYPETCKFLTEPERVWTVYRKFTDGTSHGEHTGMNPSLIWVSYHLSRSEARTYSQRKRNSPVSGTGRLSYRPCTTVSRLQSRSW